MDNKGIARAIKELKRDQAQERQAERNKRTVQEQIEVLAKRGITSSREIDRLTKG